MRFLADMGISGAGVEALIADGHGATQLRQEGLQQAADEIVLAKAVSERRVLLTHDLDMARLVALARAKTPSLVTFRLSNMRPDSVIPRLKEAIRVFRDDMVAGAAVTVDDRSIRCHRLPMGG
ncbi:MAG: DUF5615 family PIN-like protein [Planctomycetota bacterium]|nr:DUF5615 family PIN-like protein [Planctomycetota bacterium]